MLKKELLDILCCPQCKGDLDYKVDRNELVCKSCGKVYAVRDDIPIMLVDDSTRRVDDLSRQQREPE
ncbi:MAG: Trm112 family protein [Ignavibacteriales bacterium]|nr:Trm112 family protein [Ignavibacteriales bacterium]